MNSVMKMTYAEFWAKITEASPRLTLEEISETCYNWGKGTEIERTTILAALAKLAAPLKESENGRK